jgi:hypothetical protein
MFVMIPEQVGLTITPRAGFSCGGIRKAHGSRRIRRRGEDPGLQRIHSLSSMAQSRLAQHPSNAAIHAAFLTEISPCSFASSP